MKIENSSLLIKRDDLIPKALFFRFTLSEQLVLILLFLLIRVKPSSLLVQMGKNWYFGITDYTHEI